MSEGPTEATGTDEDVIIVKLSVAIPVFDQKCDELRMRKPKGSDLIQIGNPVEFDPISDPPRITHDPARMTKMIARLANVPSSSLNFLSPSDWTTCAWTLTPFFIPKAGVE